MNRAPANPASTNPAPASTVILVRQSPAGSGHLETLLLLRNKQIAFGGTWVFPGGCVEPDDYPQTRDSQELVDTDRAFLAAIHAATRETYEEAGLTLSPDALFSIAHWTTPAGFARRFATWFFLCPVHEQTEVRVDQQEILDHKWVRPTLALAEHDAGKLALTQPTRHTLETLQHYRSLDTLCTDLQARKIHVYPENCDHYRAVKLRRL
ncbi:MAG: NUDIX hydrolase [Pseudohongiella nitratireducens]|nr:NUDIX hydrolase [Pseudohongiella nitratireducens]MDF1622418.1 NUDIX hydrolase [Pseudohongiella nitratireducens]